MSQPPEQLPEQPTMIEPTGSIAPVDPAHTIVDPSQVPPELLAALGRLPPAVVPPAAPAGAPTPEWTEATQQAVRYIGEYLVKRCPLWAWAPWPFTPSSAQVAQALIDAGHKKIDVLGNDVADDPNGEHAMHIQTINWDGHFKGSMKDPTKFRVVSDGRPENGGIGPIISVGTPDPEAHAEDIAMMLESWQLRYADEVQPEPEPAPQPKPDGNTPVSGVMAWACCICARVVRQAADGTMPSFICAGCGGTQWRQPTVDELANVSPDERAAVDQSRGRQVMPQVSTPGFTAPGMATRQGDNDFYAQRGQPQSQQQGYIQQPDPETRAIADICWLLESIPPDARTRVVRYIRDRWS